MPPTSTTVVHDTARKAWFTVITSSRTSAPAASSAATAAGTAPVARRTHHRGQHAERLLGAEPERHDLAAHLVGIVDHEHVVVGGEVGRERLPGPAHQHAVAGGEHDLAGLQVLPVALHRDDHEVAALGDHPGEHRLADQAGAWRDHQLRHALVAAEELVVLDVVVDRQGGGQRR